MSLRYPNEIESARQARRSVSLVRQRLLNPTQKALESCMPHLRTAIDALARLQALLESADARITIDKLELRKEVSALRSEMGQVNALMQHACAFHAAMTSILTPPADDSIRYMAKGLVTVRPESTLLVEG